MGMERSVRAMMYLSRFFMKYCGAIDDYCYFKYAYKRKGFAGYGKSLSLRVLFFFYGCINELQSR